MICLVIAWVALAAATFPVGYQLCSRLGFPRGARGDDSIFLSIWIGTGALALAAFAAAFLLPLSPGVSAFLGIAFLMAWAARGARKIACEGLSYVFSQFRVEVFLIPIAVAFVCTKPINWYDTGLYHLQLMKWLREFGLVNGIALVQHRFGYVSSWFAFSALLSSPVPAGRLVAAGNSFIFLVALAQAYVSSRRIAQGSATSADTFLVFTFVPILSVALAAEMFNSTSPDLPVAFTLALIPWFIFLELDSPITSRAEPKRRVAFLSALMLGFIAWSFKLSAAPAVLFTAALVLYRSSSRLRSMTSIAVLGSFFLIPLVAAGYISSGCPFLPSTIGCLETPWSLPHESVSELAPLIHDWALWHGKPPTTHSQLGLMAHFVITSPGTSAVVVLNVLCLGLLIIRWAGTTTNKAYLYVSCFGAMGVLFTVVTAPTIRFMLGFAFVLPALSAVVFLERAINRGRIVAVLRGRVFVPASIVMALLLRFFLPPTFRIQYLPAEQEVSRLVAPPVIGIPGLKVQRGPGGLENIYAPELTDQCWNAPIPCAPPQELLARLRLRNSSQGLRAGFIRPQLKRHDVGSQLRGDNAASNQLISQPSLTSR